MRPVEFGEAVPAGTRLTLFSADKPDRHFTVMTFLIDKISGVALDLKTGVPCYQVEDEEGRIHLLLHLPIEEENEAANRCKKGRIMVQRCLALGKPYRCRKCLIVRNPQNRPLRSPPLKLSQQ